MATKADKERLAIALATLMAVLGLIRAGQLGASDVRQPVLVGAATTAAH